MDVTGNIDSKGNKSIAGILKFFFDYQAEVNYVYDYIERPIIYKKTEGKKK